jgi:squalene-associated FAD-dependent desaturase
MKKILIIGGGLSGLASALFLQRAGFLVELIEASPKLGGKTYSFERNGIKIDNGQHILMECYTHTLEYIDIIGSRDLFDFEKSLSLNSIDAKGNSYKLNVSKHFHPLNKLLGIMSFRLFSFSERISILKLLLKIKCLNENSIGQKFIEEYLVAEKQSKKVIDFFWKNIVESTMNTALEEASASLFLKVAKTIFFSSKDSANTVIPNIDLSSALVEPAVTKIINDGGKISTSEKAIGFSFYNERITEVKTDKRIITDFDFVLSAMPEYGLRKLMHNSFANKFKTTELTYSPIVTVHLWFSGNPLRGRMYNMLDGEFDWLFNHGTHVSLLKSNAKNLVHLDKNQVIKIVFSELKKYFTILTNREIKDYVVLKEKRATFISNPDSIIKRKSVSNPYSNLFIAGDWTDTGLPATIEGAIKSSIDVTEKIKIL